MAIIEKLPVCEESGHPLQHHLVVKYGNATDSPRRDCLHRMSDPVAITLLAAKLNEVIDAVNAKQCVPKQCDLNPRCALPNGHTGLHADGSGRAILR